MRLSDLNNITGKQWLANLGPLGITLVVSLVIHAVLIIAITFEPPVLKLFKDRMPPLDIVLVNSKTESKPNKADLLAQANLNRGGNTEDDRRMKSALPPPKETPPELTKKPELQARPSAKIVADVTTEAERRQQHIADLERQAQELMSQINSTYKVESKPTQKSAAPDPAKSLKDPTAKVSGVDLMASSLDIARLEAQIAKQQDDYQKRPKRKYIGARTQEYRFAAYVESWRQKVEKIGNMNYPEAAKDQKLYGQLRMTVSIRSDGSIESIEVNQSSGYKVLDDAAKRIVEMAAPYAVFPEDIKKDTDILGITRTWTFTKEDSLSSE
ncbi:energy transducer TonB [Methylovorus sp. MM2]|uniref:energy transducer TonB n=1 Tax=Methylovorus sp. MM2 TaxID=1848038 RepID=UPI0009EF1889|nr:energy transducer TonB [Methylovorus sp. MM2]